MNQFKRRLIKSGFAWHRSFLWLGAFALFMFSVSGVGHILMTWTGPQARTFYPPVMSIDLVQLEGLDTMISKWSVSNARLIKVVPAPDGVLLQVTEMPGSPRRYFDLSTHQELEGYEPNYAQWLARYYTGLHETPIQKTVFQTEFTADYPSVNRLLTVY